MANIHDRLVLGTVQLGMPYGIANNSGQPDYQRARAIIAAAWEAGIDKFDTAQGYGDSESFLAKALTELGLLPRVRVFTKLHPDLDHTDSIALQQAIGQSSVLFGPSLHCLMLHREEFLQYWSAGLGEQLREYRDQGLFSSIGISVYDPPAARRALETEGIDLVQLPANVLDRRHERAGVMDLARSLGKTIMIRSVFLQGALLLPFESLPDPIKQARPYLESIARSAQLARITPKELSLGFVRDHWPACLVVFGAEQVAQVQENAFVWTNILQDEVLQKLVDTNPYIPLEVIRPDLWDEDRPRAVGSRLRLRSMRPSDAWGEYVKWMNDPQVTRFLESRFCSYSSEELEQYILDQRSNPASLFLAIEEICSGRHIGNIKIGPRHKTHETAELGFLIGVKECWGKGFATEAIALAVELAFKSLSVRKVVAGCYRNNVASEKVFIKNGFVCEGVLREHVLDGQNATDVLIFGIMRDSWHDRKHSTNSSLLTPQCEKKS
ncbi:MAG: GNAT family N-acetyltransferase [Proteobacteria bacterium]|nr:GNAT family N-acetyltransferase [Pseudomonadota bacterium]